MLKKKQRPDKTAYANSIRLLSMREHSEQQLVAKLVEREFDEAEIAKAIERLKADNYLSDKRFAEAYFRSRLAKLYGPVRIRLELKERGVASHLISALFEDEEQQTIDWYEVMRQAYQRKYADTKPEDFKEKAKRCRYLQSRGFSSSQIMQLVDV